MTVLFDTNILIDAAVSTRAHHGAAVRLFAAAERGDVHGLYAPTSIATCWYIAHEKEDTDPRALFQFVADVMDAAPMGRPILKAALQNDTSPDVEDAYLAAAGAEANASAIVTRNEPDFVETSLTPYHPLDLLQML
jgi:predicted nucleic acid-binding protein